jgi:hypothetical protein
MSQRLSTSVTFQNLEGRLTDLETKVANRFTTDGNLSLESARLPLIDLSKDGVVNWRLGNWNGDPATNSFTIGCDSTVTATFDTAGNATFGGIVDAHYLRSSGSSAPTSGSGVELQWDGVTGYVLSFDRSGSAFKPIVLAGSSITLNPQGGVIALSGTTTFGDINFGATFAGSNPLLAFDSTDYLTFNRSSNAYQFIIGNAPRFTLDTTGASSDQFQAPTLLAKGVPGAGSIRLSRSSIAGTTGILELFKSDGLRSGYVGSNTDAGAMQYGSDSGAGHNFTGGPVTFGDANFGVSLGSNPQISFDLNDGLVYDRSANKFYFVVGGVNVASIDASGNMRLKGTLSQSVTP